MNSCAARINARPESPSSSPDPCTHYVIVRSDLPLGVLAAQLVHAAGESSPGNLEEGTYAIVLAVPDEQALGHLAVRLLRAGIAFRAIREPDLPYNNALMALGLVPQRKSVLRPFLSSLPLYRGSKVPEKAPEVPMKISEIMPE